MPAKKFSLIVVVFAFSLLIVAGLLHSQHFIYNENSLLYQYQEHKLDNLRDTKIMTLIVGDSSAGNAIDAAYFSKLSGERSVSVALTGSFGLIGTLNMIKKVLPAHPEIKNIIIMQSLDVWYRPLSLTGYFMIRSTPLSEMKGSINNIYAQYLAYLFDIQEINWFVKHLFEKLETVMDAEYDFFKQKPHTYANGKSHLKGKDHLSKAINADKVKVLSLIDRLCKREKLNCVYLHGPLHEKLVKEDKVTIDAINKTLSNTMHTIHFDPKPYALSEDKMGDSNDHVDVSYKKQSTKESYNKAFKGKF